MLFEMLTARVPFEADTVESVMVSAMLENIEPPSRYRDDIAPGSTIDEVVSRATEKIQDRRYHTATELRADLEQIQNELEHQR
jgi:serine/threonine protein kinase